MQGTLNKVAEEAQEAAAAMAGLDGATAAPGAADAAGAGLVRPMPTPPSAEVAAQWEQVGGWRRPDQWGIRWEGGTGRHSGESGGSSWVDQVGQVERGLLGA